LGNLISGSLYLINILEEDITGMKIGFIGLGIMGRPLALNLLKSGVEITVFDKNTAPYEECRSRGAKTANDISEIIDKDVICLCLPNSKIVESIFWGKNGTIDLLKPGQSVVDFSTITYSSTLKLAEALKERGIAFLDAPISGMEARAIEGNLTIMCGGDKELFDKMLPSFKHASTTVIYMGASGNGQLTKLINQLLFDINVAALAEVLPMSVKMGLDPEKVGEIINSGTGRSFASDFFIPRTLKGIFNEGYALSNAYKDLVSAAELAAEKCLPMPLLAAATSTYQMALLRGYGSSAKGAMIKVFEELLGVEFRKEKE
jgi:3-hydroxyisobutyrate dehydrogenase-like beta-hydroxyacid dehydrogenase